MTQLRFRVKEYPCFSHHGGLFFIVIHMQIPSKLLSSRKLSSVTIFPNAVLSSLFASHFSCVFLHHVKYVGIFVDEHLSWNYHVKELANKLSQANSIIYGIMLYFTLTCMVSYFQSKGILIKLVFYKRNVLNLFNFRYTTATSMMFAKDNLLKFEDIITSNKLKLALD